MLQGLYQATYEMKPAYIELVAAPKNSETIIRYHNMSGHRPASDIYIEHIMNVGISIQNHLDLNMTSSSGDQIRILLDNEENVTRWHDVIKQLNAHPIFMWQIILL